jgi:DNA-binding response OmpR family regulator
MSEYKLLIAEDDVDLGNVLKMFIEMNGFSVTLVTDGNEACEKIEDIAPDLCVLDINMPGKDGFTTAQFIRKRMPDMPIVFLTARNQKQDRVKGLKLGADDYITKPFEPDELVLRLQNILKRTYRDNNDNVVLIGNYRFYPNDFKLVYDNDERVLTEKECELIKYLNLNRNRTIKRKEILDSVWGDDDYFTGRSMDVFITRVRKFLASDKSIKIENIRGVGYRFVCK